MRKLLKPLLFILLFSCGNPTDKISDPQLVSNLENLVETEDFFKLKTVYRKNMAKLTHEHSLYFSAIINNVFNKAEESNKDIDLILADYSTSLNDTLMNKLYRTKLLNHVNLYEYADAAKTSAFIQSNYLALNDSSEVEMLENEIKIWEALKDVPKQEIVKTDDATIPMTRDKVGLFNIDVTLGDSDKNLLFDTGANFSVMIRSLAEELGYQIIEADFYVTAATGKKVKSDIAIADELNIGGIIFKNVFFLVLDDENLSFPQIDYYINGAIGFPVIEAMDEIRINKENQIFVPKKSVDYKCNNLALNGLMPVIAVEYKGDTLRLHFDTGAARTSLYRQFYKEYKQEIDSIYKKETFTSGSGGGMVDFEGYIINNVNFKVADSETRLDSLRLHIENIGGEESNFHGNFGQDYIKQFDEMIMSFKYSSILFK
jgi:predicted aspartyl protease